MEARSHIYAHLVSLADPSQQVLETVKLDCNQGSTVAQATAGVVCYLQEKRDDGNKLYEVVSAHEFDICEAALEENHVLEQEDLFVLVRISIDRSKHVKPIAKLTPDESKDLTKYTTISKYTYFESGSKYVKVQLPDLAGLADEPLDVSFDKQALSVKVRNFKGKNWQFTVPKLQCRILPPDCKWQTKSSCLQLTLRKKSEQDNWHSLFKNKAIGERDSDDDSDK